MGDAKLVDTLLEGRTFAGAIHFAGLKAVGESTQKPFLYFENNVSESFELFRVLEKHGVRNIVFSSSATVYDGSNDMPLTESSVLGTTNPYGTSKLMLEQTLEDLSRHANWNVIALRYFNPIGAHPSGYLGEVPNGTPNNLLPYVLDVAAGKRDCVRVFGNDYDTPDGTGVRDYIDVNDLVDAHLAAFERLNQTQSGFDAINIGTGNGTSVLEMIHMVESVSGKTVAYEISPRRPGDLGAVYANADKAKRVLGWSAKRSVPEGVEGSWKFTKKRYGLS